MRNNLYSLKIVFIASLLVASILPVLSAQQGLTVIELWNNAMPVDDLAVSRDGSYIAVVNSTGLYFFNSHNPVVRWWYLTTWGTTGEQFMSVAISGDGDYVIVGNNTKGAIYYFDGGDTRTGLQPSGSWKWVSKQFAISGGNSDVERRTIDISDDGQFVVVGGTGSDVYYFFGCTSRSGIGNSWDWSSFRPALVDAVDMSPNGKYVAAGGASPGEVAFYADANVAGGASRTPTWYCERNIGHIVDIAVSDDGYAVAAVSQPAPTLHYWSNAKSLTGQPLNTWNRTYGFGCVDLSSNGDNVVTGSSVTGSLHFWDDARTLSGKDIAETWTRVPIESVYDVGINDNGNIIAAVVPFGDGPSEVYFYTGSGDLIAHFTHPPGLDKLSMSGNGGITAVGGKSTDSLYVFEIPIVVGGEVFPTLVAGQLVFYALSLVILAGAGCSLLLRRRRVQ